MITFDAAFDRLIGHEAGYVNDPQDPGGETKWGISKRTYPRLIIADLTMEDAKAIYYRDFWSVCGEGLDTSVMFQVFDASVNHGPCRAVMMLQEAVGVANDGEWGPISRDAYRKLDKNDVLILFLAIRLEFMCNLRKFDRFGRGWSRRVAKNLRYAAEDN